MESYSWENVRKMLEDNLKRNRKNREQKGDTKQMNENENNKEHRFPSRDLNR